MNETLTRVFQQDIGAQTPVKVAVWHRDTPDPRPHVLLNPYGVIGRSPNCDIRLRDSQVSFRHAYLQMIGGRLFCADLGSRSGTRWSDQRHRAGWLMPNDQVLIGPYHLQLNDETPLDGVGTTQVPADFDPLAIYDGQLGKLPDVRLEFLNAADDVDLPLRRMLTFAGSARGCKLRFEGDRISRVHCSLLLTPSGLWIIDLLGKGGTKVNGSLIRSDRLNDGDIVKIGQFQMRVHYEDSGTATAEEAALPPETSVETSSSTDEEFPKAPQRVSAGSDSGLELADSDTQFGSHCGRLVDELIVNKLLTREQVDEVLAEFEDRIPTFDELSDRLVELKLISQWQADQLATENHGPLILENRYKLIDRLGYGSMGNVFLAFDEALQSDVAIKIPHHSLLENERLFKRFRRETLISANLVHTHIVRALNIGRGNQFVVLELVDGDDLRDLIDRQGLQTPMMAVDFLIQVAEPVDFARSQGVVHRDIKPSNILISRNGTAKLFDFGLAHLDEEALSKGVAGRDAEFISTRNGFAVGTVHYMSPEQARESDDVDTRSDIYSLGCTFYEMLTGKPPFEGENQHDILKQHAYDSISPIEGLDSGLTKILDGMLVKDREQRIQSPRELIDLLQQWQSDALTDSEELAAREAAERARIADEEKERRQFAEERDAWQRAVEQQKQDLERAREDFENEQQRQREVFDQRASDLDAREGEWTVKSAKLDEQLAEAAQIETQLTQQKQAFGAERERIDEDLSKIAAQQAELDRRAAELDAACAECEKREELLDSQRDELAERQTAFEHLLNDHDVATQEIARDRDGLTKRQQELDRSLAGVREERDELEQARAALENQREEFHREQAALQQGLAELSAEADAVSERQSQLLQVEAEIAERSAALESEREQFAAVRSDLNAARAELDRLRSELDAELAAYQADVERLRNDREKLEAQRREQEQAAQSVEQEAKRVDTQKRQLADERAQLTSDRTALQARTEKLKAALAAWFDE